MKNTVRVQRNGATKRTTSQVQTSSNSRKALEETAAQKERREQMEYDAEIARDFAISNPPNYHPSCLAIVDRMTMKPIRKIPITEDEFQEVITANIVGKPGAEEFFASAIREKISGDSLLYQLRGLADELHHCVLKTDALDSLVSTQDEHDEGLDELFVKKGLSGFKRDENLAFGISLLKSSALAELKKIRSAILQLAYSQKTNQVPA